MTQANITPSPEFLALMASAPKLAQASAATPKATPKATSAVTPKAIAYGIRPGARPSGRQLHAYTLAWLHASGLLDGGTMPRRVALQVAGATAIGYHVNSTGMLADDKGALTLAAGGREFFLQRGYDSADVDAYIQMLADGKPDGRLIKNTSSLGPIKA